MNGHFTSNFHYYEQRFQKLFYILTVEPSYRIFLVYHVTSRNVPKRTVIRRIFGIRGRDIVGTLTSKASMIIQYYLVPHRLSADSKTRYLE